MPDHLSNTMAGKRSQTPSAPVAPVAPVSPASGSSSSVAIPRTAASTSSPSMKELLPEKASDIKRRSLVVLSFWLIVLLLGLPFWWATTTIYRANLPLDGMLQWAEGKACKPVFPLQITVRPGELPASEAARLVQLTQHALDDLNEFSGHHLRLQLDSSGTNTVEVGKAINSITDNHEVALTVQLSPGKTITSSSNPSSNVLDITYTPNSIPSLNSASSTLVTYIADELRSTFAEEQAIISYLLSQSPMSYSSSIRLSAEHTEVLSKRTIRSLRYSPTYHLTFSLFTAGALPSTWDIEAAVREYMQPLLDVLSPIHNFTIDTQVQLYATPGAQSQVLNKDDLSAFVNAAEWPLSPSIGGAPTVNFVIYVGNQTVGLESAAETSQSWLIPQWGTVYLLAQPSSTSHIPSATLKQPMLTFAGHLLSLLGTPQSGSLPLRLSTLTRIRSADLLLRASSTLGSLARLTLALPSIAIPHSVAEGVSKTMDHLEKACANFGGLSGLTHARIAEMEAEKAFFEKSMVGQLYFPDEHKIAVYLPLLGPVGVPLVMGLIAEVKMWLKRRKEKAREAEERRRQ